jgi:predicted nucleic acid-binding protein
MTALVFVDTNVLVYSRDASEGEKQRRAMKWMTHLWRTRTGRLSYQVLQEFYVTVTQKLSPGLDREAARSEVRTFMTSWHAIPIDARVVEGAWGVQDGYRLSWWDALIVSAAWVGGCRYLLTEDLQEDQEIGSVTVVNPFRTSPGSLAGSPEGSRDR